MAKLPALKSREAIQILERAGFIFIRQKGSHCIYKKDHLFLVIPFHNKDLKTGTLRKIIIQSGMTIEEFLSFQ